MRKDSLIIFVVSIVLTLGIVGVAHYLYLQDQQLIPDEPTSKPRAVAGAVKPRPQTNQPPKQRTGKIIKCIQVDGSVFWTNASRCENADLDNTLSYYDHAKIAPPVKKNKKRKTSARQNKNSVKSIPRSMTNACSFPIGKARKIEKRSLKLKQDPSESVWRDSYCRWVADARKSGCKGVGDYLELEYLCF